MCIRDRNWELDSWKNVSGFVNQVISLWGWSVKQKGKGTRESKYIIFVKDDLFDMELKPKL